MDLGAILGAKLTPKWVQKSFEKLMDFWIGPGRALGGPGRSRGRGDRTTERGRGEGILSPKGHWGCGKWGKRASKPLDAPKGLVGLGLRSSYVVEVAHLARREKPRLFSSQNT